MIYGYARVSTLGQARDGNSLDAQADTLREHGATQIFSDHFTGASTDRPELNNLLSLLNTGDTLIVTKLDRIARSITAGIDLLDNLTSLGVKVHILNMGVLDDSPTGRLIRNVMLSFAEFEREMILERTSEGRAIKRATDPDYKEGRPTLNPENFAEIYKKQQSNDITVEQGCRMLSIGRSTWYRLATEHKNKIA